MKRPAVVLIFAMLVLLSIATGITKLVRLPAEMALFQAAGFPDALTIGFGVLQVAGGLALLLPKTRKVGAGVMLGTFCVASWVVWVSGSFGFFLLSLAFIVLATLPLWPAFERQIVGTF